MDKENLIKFLSTYYQYTQSESTIDPFGEKICTVLYTIQSKVAKQQIQQIFYQPNRPEDFKYPEDITKRIVYFLHESRGNTSIISKINEGAERSGDDYVFSLEPFHAPHTSDRSYSFTQTIQKLIQSVKDRPELGIYKQAVVPRGDNNPTANLVMIRVKEQGNEVRKYMDAYLMASDSRTFHDVYYTIGQFSAPDNTGTVSKDTADWPRNLLIFGAPGTGKSHSIKTKIEALGWQDHMQRVTFYEDYSYEKFVGAYLPSMGSKKTEYTGSDPAGQSIAVTSTTDQNIEYRFVPGVFLKMIADAKFDSIQEPVINHVLVIEEINRANAASVFGDFFQLLDRDSDGVSEYPISLPDEMKEKLAEYLTEKEEKLLGADPEKKEKLDRYSARINAWIEDFRLPGNLYLWATMNSADQGVYPMDAAFKRRWSYLYKTTAETSGYTIKVRWKDGGGRFSGELSWDALKTAINDRIEQGGNVEEDRFVGPWFFNRTEIAQITRFTDAQFDKRGTMPDPITNKLLQYLRQDVARNDPTKLFHDEYLSMRKIREGMLNGVGLNEILKLNGITINRINDDPSNGNNGENSVSAEE